MADKNRSITQPDPKLWCHAEANKLKSEENPFIHWSLSPEFAFIQFAVAEARGIHTLSRDHFILHELSHR